VSDRGDRSGARPVPPAGGPVVEVPATAVHDLRRRVLRDGDPEADVDFPEDVRPGAFHLAILGGDGHPVAVASFSPDPWAGRPGAPAWRLRGMAVDPALQGGGVGGRLLGAAVERLRAAGAAVVWAHARDTAVPFYERRGFRVEGDGFLATPARLPHHVVVREL
jgi:GNAT superfamily N-acetyltransferase